MSYRGPREIAEQLYQSSRPPAARRWHPAIVLLRGALPGVERPEPERVPSPIRSRLIKLSTGARATYDALLEYGSNCDGAIFARREAVVRKRRELGASERGNSLPTISRHYRELEDAEVTLSKL